MQETFAFGTLSRLIPQVFSFNKVNAHIRTHHKDLLHIYKAPTLSHLKREFKQINEKLIKIPPTPPQNCSINIYFSSVQFMKVWPGKSKIIQIVLTI